MRPRQRGEPHAQGSAIDKIDTNYMPKLDAILKDITSAQAKTAKLLQGENRPDPHPAKQGRRQAPGGDALPTTSTPGGGVNWKAPSSMGRRRWDAALSALS